MAKENFKIKFTSKDIDRLIDTEAEENINLEFKRGDALTDKKRKEIAKDVSAFANSDGGIIVYGIEERNHKASNLFFVKGSEITKEWLEQVINSRIHRRIEGLIIDVVRYEGKLDNTLFIVKIPRSLHAPHQTSDKKFYKRYNFQSVEMEEYEIRDLYTRQDKTQLTLSLNINVNIVQTIAHLSYIKVKIQLNVKNIGNSLEKDYKVEIKFPETLALYLDKVNNFGGYFIRKESDYYVYSFPNKSALFKDEEATIIDIDFPINKSNFLDIQNHALKFKLYFTNGFESDELNPIDLAKYKGRRPVYNDYFALK